jgi:hypothetical protein
MISGILAITSMLAYRPFLDPLPVWQPARWPWLLLPLCIGVSIVYKCARCKDMSRVPRETATIAIMILLGMAAAALVLAVVVQGLSS